MTKSLIENFTKESMMTQSLDPNFLSNARESLNLRETAPINGNLYNGIYLMTFRKTIFIL